MTDHMTYYTDKVICEIIRDLSEESVVRGKNGKLVPKTFLPTLLYIFQRVQLDCGGAQADFSTAESVCNLLSNYSRMVAKINEYISFSPTRVNFCAFLGINTHMYSRILFDSPAPVRDALQYVEDYFVSVLQIGALNGDVSGPPAKLILQTAGVYGHGQVTVKEASDIRVAERLLPSPEELEANLKRLTAG